MNMQDNPAQDSSCMEYGVLACLLHTPPLSLPFLSQTMRWIRPDRMSRARHAPYVVRMYVCELSYILQMDHMYYHGTQHEDMHVLQDTTS